MTWSARSSIFAFFLSALILAAPVSGQAATVTVTDCTTAPVETRGRATVLDVRPDDLVLQCALAPLPGTQRILVRANDITVDGPAGGISSPFKGRSIDVRADGALTILNASLDGANSNARMRLRAATGITIDSSILSVRGADKPGRELRIECRGAGCVTNICASTLEAGRIRITGDGDIIGDFSTLRSESPRDRIWVTSVEGNVLFCGVQMLGDVEGSIRVRACGDIDLTQGVLAIGRNIDIEAGLCGTGQVILNAASLRNDFGKKGDIEITAAGGAGQVDITGATLIDDDKSVSTTDVSEINGREETPHEGFNNTVGTPNLDS
jgi:hypothetical protein